MIEVDHLTKCYGDHRAVDDLSFHVEKGQIYGFLGPNGAGKSTTMNIMTGCLAATTGDVRIGGYDIFEQPREAKGLIGYLPEQPPLYPDRTPAEYLRFVAEAKRVPGNRLREQLQRVMEQTQITDVSGRLIKNLSKGYRQRVGIAQALLGDPEVIILDEPTVGLDPKQIAEIRELILSLGEGHTVILSSHILPEVQAICDTVLIISGGKLVACDTPARLETLFAGTNTVELLCEAEETELRSMLSSLPLSSVEMEKREENCTFLRLQADESVGDFRRELFFLFARAGRPILQMNTVHVSLEDVFLELTADQNGKSGNEEPAEEKTEAGNEEAEEQGKEAEE
ncbi:MAG: ABC transporter ATP-binding protein [Oscillospiraceae bacterium]|nr:ABC transporter ATP-binding protein [Oscillospiraceae bacterium]